MNTNSTVKLEYPRATVEELKFTKDNTKFIHLRAVEHCGKISALGGMTIAYSNNDGRVSYAIANVHKKDRYVKDIGRTVSLAKLNSGEGGVWVGTVDSLFQFASTIKRKVKREETYTYNERYTFKRSERAYQ